MNIFLSSLASAWDFVCLLFSEGFDVSGDDDGEGGYLGASNTSSEYSSAPEGHEVGAYLAPAAHNGWGTVADYSFAEMDFDSPGGGTDAYDS